jgi:hypothetical protein
MESTKTNLVREASFFTFEDSAANIKLSFGPTSDALLRGIHVIKVEGSMANFPEMDAFK